MYIKNFADSLSSNSKNTYFCLLLLISLSFSHSITLQTISNKSKFPSPWSWIFRNTHAHAFSNVCRHQRIVIIFVCFILYLGHVLMKYSNVLNYVFMPFPLFYCSAIQSPSKSFTLKKKHKNPIVNAFSACLCMCVGALGLEPQFRYWKLTKYVCESRRRAHAKWFPFYFFFWTWMEGKRGENGKWTRMKATKRQWQQQKLRQ